FVVADFIVADMVFLSVVWRGLRLATYSPVTTSQPERNCARAHTHPRLGLPRPPGTAPRLRDRARGARQRRRRDRRGGPGAGGGPGDNPGRGRAAARGGEGGGGRPPRRATGSGPG